MFWIKAKGLLKFLFFLPYITAKVICEGLWWKNLIQYWLKIVENSQMKQSHQPTWWGVYYDMGPLLLKPNVSFFLCSNENKKRKEKSWVVSKFLPGCPDLNPPTSHPPKITCRQRSNLELLKDLVGSEQLDLKLSRHDRKSADALHRCKKEQETGKFWNHKKYF